MKHVQHWGIMPSPHGTNFEDLFACVLEGLGEMGVTVGRGQVVFACMPSLGLRGAPLPPDDLILDGPGARRHHDDLVRAGCLVMEIRGAGWLPGHRYLVLLDHAWGGGSPDPCPVAWAEVRGTVWPLSVAWFERLERHRRLRPLLHSLADRRWRRSADIPVRPYWNVGEPGQQQGCPTLILGERG